MTLRLGISMGDPNGVGPEIVLRCLAEPWPAGVEWVLVGDRNCLRKTAELFNLPAPNLVIESDVAFPEPRPGEVCARAGAASHAWVKTGVDACLRGELNALVTAPVCKEAWMKAGITAPGHTELLAERCGTRRFGMLLAGRGLRVMLATRHVPLRKVVEVLTPAELRKAVELLAEGLPWLGVENPAIAVCGLNPHAGDGGGIGTEEVEWIAPLVAELREKGFPVTGPVPADTVFHQAVNGAYDAVVALYHDQGLAPLKLWAFDEGVNVTLGLPIVRTSPDHGTAFNIAGKGIARVDSMREAMKLAVALAQRENPWIHKST